MIFQNNINIINNFNNLIIQLKLNKSSNYTFKIKSFNNVINIINNLNYDINIDNFNNITSFSDKIKLRIKEILLSGSLSEIHNSSLSNSNSQSNFNKQINLLISITGIGPSKAQKLIDSNIYFEDLIKFYNNPEILSNTFKNNILSSLTHHQKIGILYYYDLQKKIPNYIIKQIQKYLDKFNFQFTICGSYRRNKEYSGDIDILIKQDNYNLQEIISILTKDKFLISHLTNSVKTKYMGICKLSSFNQFMRIDIRLVQPKQYPYAILYFTGSKNTNTFMRNKAISLGLKLNEYGLYKNNEFIKLTSEKMIFEYLKLDYLSPENR